jgi:hypothetical protein
MLLLNLALGRSWVRIADLHGELPDERSIRTTRRDIAALVELGFAEYRDCPTDRRVVEYRRVESGRCPVCGGLFVDLQMHRRQVPDCRHMRRAS